MSHDKAGETRAVAADRGDTVIMPIRVLGPVPAGHRAVGALYFVFAVLAGIIGVAFSFLVRMEMEGVGIKHFYGLPAALFRLIHGLVMIFFMMVPALFCGFGNWLVPLMTGAGDMAFPCLNRVGFWLFILAFLLFSSALFVGLSTSVPMAWLVAALHIAALSAVFSAVNFIVTIIAMRAPGVTFSRMPPFVWSILIASFLLLMCMPVMTGAVTRWLGSPDLQMQGDGLPDVPRLQIMLWFFSHPEIYVLLLPAFGIISHVVAAFTASPLYAEKAVAAAMAVIGLAGFILWTHNLFADADKADMQAYFYNALPIIGLPTGFIILCWFATIWHGRVDWRVPMLWAAGFMFVFAAGMILSLHLALSHAFSGLPVLFVSYFHYVVSIGSVFAIFSGWYFWFPEISGYAIRELTGKVHFWMMFFAVNLIFLPQHLQGFTTQAFAGPVRLSGIGTVIAACSLGVFLYGIAEAFIRRKPASKNPWGQGAVIPEHFQQKCETVLRPGNGSATGDAESGNERI